MVFVPRSVAIFHLSIILSVRIEGSLRGSFYTDQMFNSLGTQETREKKKEPLRPYRVSGWWFCFSNTWPQPGVTNFRTSFTRVNLSITLAYKIHSSRDEMNMHSEHGQRTNGVYTMDLSPKAADRQKKTVECNYFRGEDAEEGR